MDADKLVEQYVALREQRGTLKSEYENTDTALKERMEGLADELKEIIKGIGAESVSTAHGTVYRIVKTRYWAGDWDAIKKFVREHDALDLLERRIHQTNMKQWMEEHPAQVPPGLNIDSKYDVVVRRK